MPTAFLGGPPVLLQVAYVLLLLAAVALLATMALTLPRRDPYERHPDVTSLPAPLAGVITAGWWIGAAVVGLAFLAVALTSAGGASSSGTSRFGMCLLAALGAAASLFTGASEAALVALMVIWGAVVALALVRGVWGLVSALVRGDASA